MEVVAEDLGSIGILLIWLSDRFINIALLSRVANIQCNPRHIYSEVNPIELNGIYFGVRSHNCLILPYM